MHSDVVLSTGFRIGLRRADGRLSDIDVDARRDIRGSGINVKDIRQDFQIIDVSLCRSRGILYAEGLRMRRGAIDGSRRFTIVGGDLGKNGSGQT